MGILPTLAVLLWAEIHEFLGICATLDVSSLTVTSVTVLITAATMVVATFVTTTLVIATLTAVVNVIMNAITARRVVAAASAIDASVRSRRSALYLIVTMATIAMRTARLCLRLRSHCLLCRRHHWPPLPCWEACCLFHTLVRCRHLLLVMVGVGSLVLAAVALVVDVRVLALVVAASVAVLSAAVTLVPQRPVLPLLARLVVRHRTMVKAYLAAVRVHRFVDEVSNAVLRRPGRLTRLHLRQAIHLHCLVLECAAEAAAWSALTTVLSRPCRLVACLVLPNLHPFLR